MTPSEIVFDVLSSLNEAVGRKDTPTVLSTFEPNGVLAGTSASSVGAGEISAYLDRVVGQPEVLSWDWNGTSLVADGENGIVWFFIEGDAIFNDPDTGVADRQPMRLTGVLRLADGNWRWAQFHGSVPQTG